MRDELRSTKNDELWVLGEVEMLIGAILEEEVPRT